MNEELRRVVSVAVSFSSTVTRISSSFFSFDSCIFVIDASRDAGATGGTILSGRGSGVHENESFLGVSIQPEKEIVVTLVKKENKKTIMQEICDRTKLEEHGKGICFSMPVNKVAGITMFKDDGFKKVSSKEENKTDNE